MPDPAKPWKLIYRGVKPWEFPTRESAMTIYNTMRLNSRTRIPDAALFGPGGEAWYCRGSKYAQWQRDDERRKREPEPEEATA